MRPVKHPPLAVIVALLFTGIWVVPWSTSPFQAEKSVVLILLALYALPWLSRRGWILLAGVLTLSLVIAGPAWRIVLYGNDYRWMGILTWLSAGVLTWAWACSTKSREMLALLLSPVATLSLVILVLAQKAPFIFVGHLSLWHPAFAEGGLLGNRAFLSTALTPLVLYWGGFAVWAFRLHKWRRGLWWGGHALVAMMGIVLSNSRGGWLGLGLSVIVVGGFLWRGVRRYAWWIGSGGIAIGGIVWGITHPQSSLWDFIYRNGTLQQRFIVWQSTVRLLTHHPWRALFGFGADTLGLYFPEVYPAILMRFEPDGRAHVFDRAHNILLDVWVQFGLVGLLMVLIGVGWVARRWLQVRQQDARMWGAFGGWVALLGTWLVHFPTPMTLLLAGVLAVESVQPYRVDDEEGALRWLLFGYGLSLGVLAFLWGSVWLTAGGTGSPVMYVALVLGVLWIVNVVTFGPSFPNRARIWRGFYSLVVTALVGAFFVGDVLLGWAIHAEGAGQFSQAVSLGQQAWRLCPRERTAWQIASFWLDHHKPPTSEDVQRALFWLSRAPTPHTAAWWFVYLDTMRVAYEVGVKSREEVNWAFIQARLYFPENREWDFTPP